MSKVNIFCPVTLPFKSGAGLNAFNLAKSLREQGHSVRIVSFKENQGLSKEVIEGINIIRISRKNKTTLSKVLAYFFIIPSFIKYVVKGDLSIVFGPLQGYVFLIVLGKVFNKKVVFRSTMYGKDDIITLNKKYGNNLYRIRKYLHSKMGGYIAQSPAMTKSLKNEYGTEIPYLESAQGVDTKRFFPLENIEKEKLKKQLGVPNNTKVLISIGYVIERKGYREIFDALKKIKGKEEFKYYIIGNHNPNPDHYMYYLKDEMNSIYDYGKEMLGDQVVFLGELNDVEKYLQIADVFLLNSLMEGMPNVLLEAMACGLPSIVKELAGVNDYITFDKKNCFIVQNNDDIANRLIQLLKDENLLNKMGHNAYELINTNFSISRVSEKVINKFAK